MPLTEDTITWTGKTVGVTLEVYNDKYAIKAVRSFESQGATKLSYDWAFPQEYDKAERVWKPKAKASPVSVYLGDRETAIKALSAMLKTLGGTQQDLGDDAPPF